jgi:nitrogenase molybdenum-cofactor synthesis protein NifE
VSYQYTLNKLKKISQIENAKDIKQLSNAQFPGTHCPLFGVALTAGYVKDLVALVVGTDECTYYTKTFAMDREYEDKEGDNFLSFAINQDDVVFGCGNKIEDAVLEIEKKYNPKAIMLVTTCVLEVIGEDFEAIVFSLQDRVKAKLLVVHTEHFKCNSHIPGIERTLEALGDLMEEQAVDKNTVNLLGPRYSGVENTELLKLLKSKGITINLVLPSRCGIEKIQKAPSAKLNIVTDFTALSLAEKMKRKFGIEYVYFDKYLSVERIEEGYRKVAECLNLDIDSEISSMASEAKTVISNGRRILEGKKFIYGNTPMLAFEVSSFLCSLGMEPALIQARDLYINDDLYMKEILNMGHDPYVSRIANIAPLQVLYSEIRPDIYIGHENPQNLMKNGIMQVVLDSAASKLGFEVPMTVVRMMAGIVENYGKMPRKEGHHAAI